MSDPDFYALCVLARTKNPRGDTETPGTAGREGGCGGGKEGEEKGKEWSWRTE